MTLSNHKTQIKCCGCGVKLSLKKDNIGYVPRIDKNTKFCQRCFKLKYYGINDTILVNEEKIDIKNKKSLISEKNIVCLVVDPFNIKNSLLNNFKNNKNLVVVVNKMDLFNSFRDIKIIQGKIIKNVLSYGFNPLNIFFCSTKTKSSIKKMLDYFEKNIKTRKNLVFVGLSNVGKSSIVNTILKFNNKNANKFIDVTISNKLNTTISQHKINYSKNITIIDTPGYVDRNNILNFIDYKNISKINVNKISRVRNFQIKHSKRIIIENLIMIDILEFNENSSNIKILMNDCLKTNVVNISDNYVLNQMNLISYTDNDTKSSVKIYNISGERVDFCFPSLGLVNFRKIKKIRVICNENIDYFKINFNIV